MRANGRVRDVHLSDWSECLFLSLQRSNVMFSPILYVLPVIIVVGFFLITATVKILREYERAVVFTLGRFQKVKGPGLVLLIPFFQEMVRVDLRIQVIEIPSQDVISRDNVSMKVDAVLYFNVVNPERAIIKVQSYLPATNMLAQTTLRAVLGQHELDEMLSERKKLSTDVQSILDAQTETWGIKVSNVEIRTVELTENMVRAIAKQAEAERDRRAKIIHAEAEFQASQTLVNAAQILSSIPAAMQLRYLQTLTEIGAEQNSTIVFPMPIDIIKPFLDLVDKTGKPARANGASRIPHAEDAPLGVS
jgi:regulator of protease activity HflC (stomatin/prohibitin superfamily)